MTVTLHDPNWADSRKLELSNCFEIGFVRDGYRFDDMVFPSEQVCIHYNDKDIKTVQGTVKLSEILLEVSRAINEGAFYLQEDLILSMQQEIEELKNELEMCKEYSKPILRGEDI